MNIQPYEVHISNDVLEDLKYRLGRTRWPDEIVDAEWDYGSNLAYIRELCGYWENEFDWRAQEAAINALPNYRADVDGLGVHYIHGRGSGPNPVPIVITHGWPSTFVEMLKIIPLLADPASHGGDNADSFDVVAPSMPGYGFSDRPSQRGMSPTRIAEMWHKLMTEGLGYDHFVAQGGDWGAQVTTTLGLNYPETLSGIHLTAAGGGTPIPPESELSDDEKEFLRHREWWQQAEGAYGHQHRTKPQTLSYGAERFSRRSSGVDSREVAHLERLRRRHRVAIQQGRAPDAPDDLLGHPDHKLIGALVLRKREGAIAVVI